MLRQVEAIRLIPSISSCTYGDHSTINPSVSCPTHHLLVSLELIIMFTIDPQHDTPQGTDEKVKAWILKMEQEPPRFYRAAPVPQEATESYHDRPKNKFERRKRNRTKHDRYDYKEEKVQRKLERISKQLNREIARNFHAPNVPQERLTINHRQDLGLFKNGRTSSPIRSGMPTLRFLERDFLSGIPQSHLLSQNLSGVCLEPFRFHGEKSPAGGSLQRSADHSEPLPQSIADKRNGNQLSVGTRSTVLDLSSKPDLESYTGKLLRIDFRPPTNAPKSGKVWTLEDLHCLLGEREIFWNWEKEEAQDSQRSRDSFERGLLKHMLSSSPIRTEIIADIPPRKMQRTERGYANQQSYSSPDTAFQPEKVEEDQLLPQCAARQQEPPRKVTQDSTTPTKSFKQDISCRVHQGNMPSNSYSPCLDVVYLDSRKAQMLFRGTQSKPDAINDDSFPSSPSKVDPAALEAACDAILATERDFFLPIEAACTRRRRMSHKPKKTTRKLGGKPDKKRPGETTLETRHRYAFDDSVCPNLSSITGDKMRTDANDVLRDVYIWTPYNSGQFTKDEQMQTHSGSVLHAEDCLDCRLRRSLGPIYQPTTGPQMDCGDNPRDFWQRRMLY
ncbi:uncharacterized protein BP01DRAFT_363692 [Aspergillus saccharolyticus JOP 1030-1]|uniref:Uncharacterized protein n=1 Tax=Aspergillus saccharolyticus JOP 1030-1 TaxID=1450539 RepID=A0A318ZV49_9EURO|nr:hypothetical protein BP01DRAFT_363692 [Aspergillus saccharolyticus JOP 1030-1]PYH47910.1 hypothetical protein BP01DRAFT_363692 [Aspergillus saccharolyticus JOP 1030-1]